VRRIFVCTLLALFAAQLVSAEVTLTERKTLHQQITQTGKTKPEHTRRSAGPGKATGSQALIDASGLKYFINTNITFSTSSSASGAMSEASYTAAVAATTLNGGTTSSTLNDAFDGYGAICVGLNGMTGPCVSNGGEGSGIVAGTPRVTGKALPDYIMYNQNGPATTDCNGRQIDFPVQAIDLGTTTINLSRKVFVPTNDTFARTLNIVTNTGSAAATFNLITSNNLGSDSNTKIVTSSNGNNTAETTDFWITSFQNYSGTTSSDVRLGHIIQGPGALNPVSFIQFPGNPQPDQPYWDYTITLNPGQTKIIMTFVTGQPSNAASAAKSAQIAGLPTSTLQCLTPAEEAAIVNFAAAANLIPTLGNLGLIVLCLALASFAMMRLRRRTA
jgi:hypothetical protein